ncbi:hypothetical protein GCM10011367_19570 [Marinicauda pacifica]|jgi:heme exporter protein CcmD|uniref:Heme exporter protein D n=1 Tax=Marinicauda pacifica TaxID=1133559 RepID=A0A4S2HD09_9PROT|nr:MULTISPECIES: heme exporter protein CcmD [Marinicauda]TGY93342.1 heme exporter protein CcmD [Marinicauda pacifica]GGE44910.1 hypothetical protein GCM10011367_19570 [Marinicauda pacifica]
MSDFLSMSGYGAYVWGSYGLTLAVIGALTWWTLAGRRGARERLARIQAQTAEDSRSPHDSLPRGDAPRSDETGYTL